MRVIEKLGLDRRSALACLAISLNLVGVWLLNVTVYPSFNDFFPEARDIATTAGGLILIAFAATAMRWPRVLTSRWLFFAVLGLGAIGMAGALISPSVHSGALATLCSILRGMPGHIYVCYLALVLAQMDGRQSLVVLVLAYLLKYLWMGVFSLTPYAVKCGAFVVTTLVIPCCMRLLAAPGLKRVATMEAPAELSLTNPRSFVPFTSRIFVVILLFQAAFGFALTYGSHNSYPQATLPALAVFACVVAFVLLRPHRSDLLDALYTIAFVLALAGLLFALGFVGASPQGLIATSLAGSLTNTLLSAGSEVVNLTMLFVVAAVSRRSFEASLPLALAVQATGSLGLEMGALTGHLQNYLVGAWPDAAIIFAVAMTLAFATYNFCVARRFSFDGTVTRVQPVEPVSAVDEGDEQVPAIERRCEELVCAHGLTAREAQVLGLLARGRNAAYIQETLTLSRNTVKSYVARVYAKLGVHSHQEVIDLVEGSGIS